MPDYVNDVAQILSQMEENLDEMNSQTKSGIHLMKSLETREIPDFSYIGKVSFRRQKHPHIVDYFQIIENKIPIGYLYFQGYRRSDMWQIVMSVFGTEKKSNFTARSRVLNSLLSLLAQFDLEAKEDAIIRK